MLTIKLYLHQGGESKYSHSSIHVSDRFSDQRSSLAAPAANPAIDGIINIGFGKQCDYSMRVYVPSITNQHTPRIQQRKIRLLHRDVDRPLTIPRDDLKTTEITWLLSLETLE